MRGGVALAGNYVPGPSNALDIQTVIESLGTPKEGSASTGTRGYFKLEIYDSEGNLIRTEHLALTMTVTVKDSDLTNDRQEGMTPKWNPTVPPIGLVFAGNNNTDCANPCSDAHA